MNVQEPTETMIFLRKADAQKVSRRLRNFGVLSSSNGREVTAYWTKSLQGEQMRDFMRSMLEG